MLFFCFEQNLQQSFSALNFGREATQKQHTAPFKKKKNLWVPFKESQPVDRKKHLTLVDGATAQKAKQNISFS